MDDGDFEARLKRLLEDRNHGASELARTCLEAAAESARGARVPDGRALVALLGARAEAMSRARPSMAPIANLLGRWRGALGDSPADDLAAAREFAAQAALRLIEDSREAARQAAAAAVTTIGEGRTIITHSLSSTVIEVFRALSDSGVRAIVTESRPLFEGRELASRLSEWSIPTTLITEAEIGIFVSRADAAIVGADSLTADGSVVNKAGTYLLALAARDQGIPFYVCAESFKRLRPGIAEPTLEAMDPGELGAPDWPGVAVANVYFEITPARLITAWFSEEGKRSERIFR